MNQVDTTIYPNLFVVGAAKSGTTTLYYHLSRHPEVYLSPIKEPHHFCSDIRIKDFHGDYRKTVELDVASYLQRDPLSRRHIAFVEDREQYLRLYRERLNQKIVGEMSTGYLYSGTAASSIAGFNPDAKIIMILRQPVERAFSHYLMSRRTTILHSSSDFVEAIENDRLSPQKGWGISHLYIELGLYAAQVRRYLHHFPAEQVKICLYDDLRDDAVSFMADILNFLGLDLEYIRHIDVLLKDNTAAQSRFPVLHGWLRRQTAVNAIIDRITPQVKRSLKNIMLTPKGLPTLSREMFLQVLPYFADDIEQLGTILGRDLSSWLEYRQPSNGRSAVGKYS